MPQHPVLEQIDTASAVPHLEGVVERTPLVPFDAGDERVELRLKLECLQHTGSFKARGAWNQVRQLTPAEREQGVVASSSGNHGRALSWAAQRAGVKATIYMPEDAYPNKIQACRDLDAEVVLTPTRIQAEEEAQAAAAAGAVMIHPYDSARTIEGAGSVGYEIAQDWPEVEVAVFPVGGGGLIAGSSLALHRALGAGVRVLGAEPEGAITIGTALAAGAPVLLEQVETSVQGLCPMSFGTLNTAVALDHVASAHALSDPQIHAAQARLVREGGWTVEPAGACAPALVFEQRLPAALLEGRDASHPLRVVAVVSGGNPDPAQLEALLA